LDLYSLNEKHPANSDEDEDDEEIRETRFGHFIVLARRTLYDFLTKVSDLLLI
jgi:hypothetical protein